MKKIISSEGFLASALSAIDSMDCPDDDTIVIKLKEANATFVSNLAWYGNCILPQHLYDTDEDWTTIEAATSAPVGTGPFKFVEAKSGSSITLEKRMMTILEEHLPLIRSFILSYLMQIQLMNLL